MEWTAPASNGGSNVNGYVVTPYADGVAQTARTFNTTFTSQVVTGLVNGTTYTFRVAANAVGVGPQSAASNAVTPQARCPLRRSCTWSRQATARPGCVRRHRRRTAAPSSTGTSSTPYVGGVAQPAHTFNSTGADQVVTGLTNGTTYTFKVAARNAVGLGPRSDESDPVTPATAPGAPTIGAVTPGNGQVMVAWTAPASNGGAARSSRYVVTPYVDGVAQPTHTFDAPNTTRAVTGLANGTTYTFRVAARNDIGLGLNSAASNPATPATLPGPPTVTSSSPTSGAVTVAFNPPASDGGSPVTAYYAQCVSADGGVTATRSGTASPIKVINLTGGSTTAAGSGPPTRSGPVPTAPLGRQCCSAAGGAAGAVGDGFDPVGRRGDGGVHLACGQWW